jgi:hypothetical protein
MAGQEQGMNIYERSSVAAGTMVTVSLSGSAPPPATASASQAAGAPGRAENVQGRDIQSVPGRLDSLKWPLVGGFCILFVLAAILLARKPVAITVPAPANANAELAAQPQSRPGAAGKNVEPSSNGDALAALDRNTTGSLDALKDQLFRLELRRQAGTISEEEYTRERGKAEQVLRDLVRG